MNILIFLALYIPGWLMFMASILIAGESARREFPELGIKLAPGRSILCAFIWPPVVVAVLCWAVVKVVRVRLSNPLDVDLDD